MKKKRTFLVALAMVLVCILSITGTLAFLQANTSTVTNTFIAAGGPGPFVDPDPNDPEKQLFAIKEYKVTQATSGMYTKTTDEVDGLEYGAVMPGTVIPKQAFVKLSRTAATKDGKTIAPAPAYLFLEVIDNLPEAYTWAIEDTNWTKLEGVVGVDEGEVYLYTGSLADATHVITDIAAYSSNMIDIIKDDQVTVAEDAKLTDEAVTLSFNAYLSQASTGTSDDPATVFTACFK